MCGNNISGFKEILGKLALLFALKADSLNPLKWMAKEDFCKNNSLSQDPFLITFTVILL